MEAFGERRDAAWRGILTWLLVAKRLGVCRDITRLIERRLYDEELPDDTDPRVYYFMLWKAGRV